MKKIVKTCKVERYLSNFAISRVASAVHYKHIWEYACIVHLPTATSPALSCFRKYGIMRRYSQTLRPQEGNVAPPMLVGVKMKKLGAGQLNASFSIIKFQKTMYRWLSYNGNWNCRIFGGYFIKWMHRSGSLLATSIIFTVARAHVKLALGLSSLHSFASGACARPAPNHGASPLNHSKGSESRNQLISAPSTTSP
jgi:hypothetical protein